VWGVNSTVTNKTKQHTPSTQITLFERTRRARGSTLWRHHWLDVDKTRLNSCVLKHLLFGGSWPTKKWPNKPGNALSEALLKWIGDISSASERALRLTPQKQTCGFFETALCAVLIDWFIQSIRGQRFWEVIFFTAKEAAFGSCANSFVFSLIPQVRICSCLLSLETRL